MKNHRKIALGSRFKDPEVGKVCLSKVFESRKIDRVFGVCRESGGGNTTGERSTNSEDRTGSSKEPGLHSSCYEKSLLCLKHALCTTKQRKLSNSSSKISFFFF
jgi:hypothetical protein